MENFPKSMPEFERRFHSEEACLEYLVQLRWPNGVVCPHCGNTKLWQIRTILECAACSRQTRIMAGTIFQGTHLPLRTWFRAIWWIVTQKHGASALGLKRVLGLSYRSAWNLLHKIRRAMVRTGRSRLTSRVEVDEAYIGGLEEGVRVRKTNKKALVLIAAQEDGRKIGRIRMQVVEDASAENLLAFISGNIEPGSTVHTDAWSGYAGVETLEYTHQVSLLKEMGPEALPCVHWVSSLLRRWMLGIHQGAISKIHLEHYLDEYVFRFNRRSPGSRGKLFQRLMELAVVTESTTYAEITKRSRPYQKPRS